ncbi:MAG: folate family ECF transporter S component, partial [Clostridia bacterium]|nr:folate family ECF transporter S component [Clostridia bacterium]
KNFQISAKNLTKTRVICISAILAALFVVLYSLKLQLAPELRITFTFIPLALSGWLLGPVPAMLVGLVGDLVGCILFPAGPYFPGFTLTQILAGLVFGLFLYRKDVKKIFWQILCSKTIISVFLNVGLNALWLSMLYGKAWTIYAASHLIKNAIALPIEVILLLLVIKVLHSRGIQKNV